MLRETILELIEAYRNDDKKKIEKTYRLLEKVGMDRFTARVVACEMLKEMNGGKV